jgi:hypothetical protein
LVPFAKAASARAEAESNCSSSAVVGNKMLALLLPMVVDPPEDPVDVSEMLDPDEKGGKERSEGEGEGGFLLLMTPLTEVASEDVRESEEEPRRRRRGLNFGASL